MRAKWKQTFGEGYFGSRDIDLGFHTLSAASAEELRRGNLPATIRYLEGRGFTREGMYQFLRFHDYETNEAVPSAKAAQLPGYAYYAIAVDLIVDSERADIRDVASFQAFAEPLLAPAFENPFDRRDLAIAGTTVHVPAPHVLLAMKFRSLPGRQKDDKSVKDLCDIYALATSSRDDPRTLRSRLHRLIPDATQVVQRAIESPFVEKAAEHLDSRPPILQAALRQLL